MDAEITLAVGQSVLVINCGPDGAETKEVSDCSDKLGSRVGSSGAVRIAGLSELGTLPSSSYDAVCVVDPVSVTKLDLPTILRVLRPDGVLWMTRVNVQHNAGSKPSADSVTSALTFAGFIKSHAEVASQDGDTGTTSSCRVRASKPSYEVGASLPLKLPAKKAAATAWTLAATDKFDDIDVIDSDTVLDADDLKKPDPASLRTCGVSDGATKRKACKNCTCGLAEQLDDAESETAQPKTSSCGNCYLGDAFRCAGCPYRGTPAFKPGEKIELPALSMQDDI